MDCLIFLDLIDEWHRKDQWTVFFALFADIYLK